MTDHGRKPKRWANDLNTILAAVHGEGRFRTRNVAPVEVPAKVRHVPLHRD